MTLIPEKEEEDNEDDDEEEEEDSLVTPQWWQGPCFPMSSSFLNLPAKSKDKK